MTTSYKCPLCNKSIVKMDALFMNLANIIKEQPMPEEFQNVRSVILCNDCSAKCSTAYHFLGLRCEICQSYNTVELDRSPMPEYRSGDEPEPNQPDPSQPQIPSMADHDQGITSTSEQPAHSPDIIQSLNGATYNRVSSDRNLRFVEPELTSTDEDEEEEFDFWGREVRSDPSGSEEEDESSDGVDESEIEDEDDDDDEDNVDDYDIVLLGHR